MMRLPPFTYHAPATIREATDLLAGAATGSAMLMAGGTDLLPNMKRRQQVPSTLIALRQIAELRNISNGTGLQLGAGLTLADLLRVDVVRQSYPGLWQAAAEVATPHLRNMGTLGGNMCLDTRCNYYDQNYEWRKSINFCMKKDGAICWVAPSSRRCLAVSSTDTAPMLMALDASVTLVSANGQRQARVADLYANDGIHYLTRRPDEILTAVHLPSADGWRSAYWKLRRRGAFDFPVLSVAAAVRVQPDGVLTGARLVLGAVASRPVEATAAGAFLIGQRLTDDVVRHAADLAAGPARPMDNTDFSLVWRKRVAREFTAYALREVRGDDMRLTRQQFQLGS